MHIEVGDFRINVVIQDYFFLDGGVTFGGIPKEVWKRWCGQGFSLDRKNRIKIPVNCFLITAPSGIKILVDLSFGDNNLWKEKTLRQFGMQRGFNRLSDSLDSPDIVVPTHLHFDHAGGCASLSGGKLVPSYPNALHIFHKDELDHLFEAHPKTRSSYRGETMAGVDVVLDNGSVYVMNTDTLEVHPGVELIRTRGHTPGHISVKITYDGETAFIPGALCPTRFHTLAACGVGNDTHALEACDYKLLYLERAWEEGWTLFLEHDFLFAGKVVKDEKANYTFVPLG